MNNSNVNRFALIIGINKFQDEAIPTIYSQANDITDLVSVLENPKIGNFQVSKSINPSLEELNDQIINFLKK